jgi:hypothetical protein
VTEAEAQSQQDTLHNCALWHRRLPIRAIRRCYTAGVARCLRHPSAVLVQAYDDLEHYETPFVVKLHRFNALADTQVSS